MTLLPTGGAVGVGDEDGPIAIWLERGAPHTTVRLKNRIFHLIAGQDAARRLQPEIRILSAGDPRVPRTCRNPASAAVADPAGRTVARLEPRT